LIDVIATLASSDDGCCVQHQQAVCDFEMTQATL